MAGGSGTDPGAGVPGPGSAGGGRRDDGTRGGGAGAGGAGLHGQAVWFSTRRGFRLGVAGMPEDRGTLEARGRHVRFVGRRLEFALARPARLSLVHEPPGLAPLGGVAVMAFAFVVSGLPVPVVLATLGVVALLVAAHAFAARWVRLEQLDEDGGTTVGYLAPAGRGRYTSGTRELLAALERRVPSPVRAL